MSDLQMKTINLFGEIFLRFGKYFSHLNFYAEEENFFYIFSCSTGIYFRMYLKRGKQESEGNNEKHEKLSGVVRVRRLRDFLFLLAKVATAYWLHLSEIPSRYHANPPIGNLCFPSQLNFLLEIYQLVKIDFHCVCNHPEIWTDVAGAIFFFSKVFRQAVGCERGWRSGNMKLVNRAINSPITVFDFSHFNCLLGRVVWRCVIKDKRSLLCLTMISSGKVE